MIGKIALEEHFALEETVGESLAFMAETVWPELRHRLLDIHDTRLGQMDEHGIELMLLSLNAPAVQAVPDPAMAVGLSQRANDFLAEQVARRPDRFQALAALPMQSPDEAARELERCVKDLGFKGAPGQRIFRSRRHGRTGLLRSSAVPAILGRRWKISTCRSIFTRATRFSPTRASTKAIPGCSAQPGPLHRRPPCTPSA